MEIVGIYKQSLNEEFNPRLKDNLRLMVKCFKAALAAIIINDFLLNCLSRQKEEILDMMLP